MFLKGVMGYRGGGGGGGSSSKSSRTAPPSSYKKALADKLSTSYMRLIIGDMVCSKFSKMKLRAAEVEELFILFEQARRGDPQGKANLGVFAETVSSYSKWSIVMGESRVRNFNVEIQKLITCAADCSTYLTWEQTTKLLEERTLLVVEADRKELVGKLGSSASAVGVKSRGYYPSAAASKSPLPLNQKRKEYRELLITRGMEFAQASTISDREVVEGAKAQKMLLDSKQFAIGREGELGAVSSRVDELMEEAAAKGPFSSTSAEMDEIFSGGDDDKPASPCDRVDVFAEPEDMDVDVGAAAEDTQADDEERIRAGVLLRTRQLSAQQREQALATLNASPTEELLTDKYNITMSSRKLLCLRPNTWLNDEVINFYMCLLQDRDAALCKLSPEMRKPSHYFNSFFMSKLLDTGNTKQYTYSQVQRWTKKFDIFSLRRIYFPINIGNSHWTHLVLYMEEREVHYYDSMAGNGTKYIKTILRWVGDEAKTKKGWENYDVSDFVEIDHGDEVPQQANGYDCGVFSCIFADFDTDNLPFEFSQAHIPNIRMRMCLDILRGELSYPTP